MTYEPLHIPAPVSRHRTSVCRASLLQQRHRQTVKLTPTSSGINPSRPICSVQSSITTKPPTYPFSNTILSKSVETKSTGCASYLRRHLRTVYPVFPFASGCLRFLRRPVAVCSASVRGYLRIGAGVRKRLFAKDDIFLSKPGFLSKYRGLAEDTHKTGRVGERICRKSPRFTTGRCGAITAPAAGSAAKARSLRPKANPRPKSPSSATGNAARPKPPRDRPAGATGASARRQADAPPRRSN